VEHPRADAPDLPFAVAFRLHTVRIGIWPTLFICACLVGYVAATWERPGRGSLLALVLLAIAGTLALTRLPLERVVASRWCEPFFVGWNTSLVLLIGAVVVLDGHRAGPLTALFFLPLVYAALSYPLRSMLAVGAIDLAGYLAAMALVGGADGLHVALVAAALGNAAWLCAWQARSQDEHRRRLAVASRTDTLTGCLNRRGFEERFAAELADAVRSGRSLGLVVVDLNGFKAVNDRDGHAAGDELLRWVGERLRAVHRAHDAVARVGGDEFALVCATDDVERVRERVIAALCDRASAAVGVARFPDDGLDADTLQRLADADMYLRKPYAARAVAGG
jgi:diguanylate cyclase (GGDEF)-like protein